MKKQEKVKFKLNKGIKDNNVIFNNINIVPISNISPWLYNFFCQSRRPLQKVGARAFVQLLGRRTPPGWPLLLSP